MKNIVLIRAKKESDWVSCQSITHNLEQAYHQAPQLNVSAIIYYNHGGDQFEITNIVNQILEESPDEIVFIDHRPHPLGVVRRLQEMAPAYAPQLTFHIFGDFVLESPNWYNINNYLTHYPVHFICASRKQQQLLDSFMNNDGNTSVIPFPVPKEVFTFDSKERNTVRKKLGLKEKRHRTGQSHE